MSLQRRFRCVAGRLIPQIGVDYRPSGKPGRFAGLWLIQQVAVANRSYSLRSMAYRLGSFTPPDTRDAKPAEFAGFAGAADRGGIDRIGMMIGYSVEPDTQAPAMSHNKTMPQRSAGPQGTRLFSAEELRLQADELAPAPTGRASVHEPVLEGVGGEHDRQRYTVSPGRQTIGRRGDNDIVIGDPSVSASHAWIMNQQGHYVIMNTLSTNGTFVNGQRVHESVLRHGDRIRLGVAEFVFLTRDQRGSRFGKSALLGIGLLVLAALAALAGLAWWLL